MLDILDSAYLGEIRLFPYGFAPRGWAKCDGAILNVGEHQTLFALIGNKFGGNFPKTFALPTISPPTIENTDYYICLEMGIFPPRS